MTTTALLPMTTTAGAERCYLDSVVACLQCDERWCLACEVHWAECSCPGPYDDDNVKQPASNSKHLGSLWRDEERSGER